MLVKKCGMRAKIPKTSRADRTKSKNRTPPKVCACVSVRVKLNDGKLFPRQSSRRFFEPDRFILRTSSMSPYEDLT